MKKKLLLGFLTVLTVALAAFSCLFIVGCGDVSDLTTLADPVINGYDPETGKVSWKFVTNADSYEVTISDGVETKTSEVKTGSITYKTSEDSFEFSIKAKNNGLFQDSNTVSVTFVKLSDAIEVSVENDGTVKWESVDGATGYEIAVDNSTVATVVDTSFGEVEAGKVHAVRVKPVKANTDTAMYFSSWSAPVSVNKLKEISPAAITYDDGAIKWSAVASAASYKVVINNTEHEVSENKLDYDAGGESFAVTVQAIGNHTSTYDGAVSSQKSFVYLPAVSGVRVENGVLTWDAIEGATGYRLKLDGANSTATNLTENKYSGLSAGRQYAVTVLPTATAQDTVYFSDWSAPANVYILPAPVLRWTGLDVDGVDKVQAINWNTIDGAGGYGYKVTLPDGKVEEDTLGATTNFYSDNFAATGTYKVEIKATSSSSDKYESAYSSPMTVTRLAAPTVTQDKISSTASNLAGGFTVSFNAVSGASGYALYKDGNRELTSTTPQFKVNDIVPADNTRETKVTFYVQSQGKISGNNIVLNSLSAVAQTTISSAFTVTVLATPTAPTIEGTVYSFTGVENGSSYSVSINAQSYTATGTSFDLNDSLAAGTHSVRVCTMGNGHEVLASTYSTAIEVQRLVAPYELHIATDESDGVLSFEGDNRASSYTAIITGRQEPLTVDTTTNIREYINTTATIIVMYSEANRFYDDQHTVYYMTSRASTNYTFYKLEAPSNVSFTNENMLWNTPSNYSNSATVPLSYKIFNGSNNVVYNGAFTGNTYSLATLEGGETYSFDIVAIGDGITCINSEPAHSRSITKLITPALTVNKVDFRYEWDSVPGASNYVLQIDSEIVSTEIHQSGNTYYYSPTYTVIGDHQVILYALGDNGETTINSKNCEYTQKVKQLSTPEFNYFYGADSFDPAAEITVNVTKETNCPNGYYYVIGTTAHYEKALSYSFNTNTSGAIDIAMYAKGSSFDEDEVYYLDSRQTLTVTLNLLGYPTVNNITVNQDGQITWGRVTGASGYIFKLTIATTDGRNCVYEGTINSNTASLSLASFTVTIGGEEVALKYKDVRTMTLELQAKGTLSANTPTTYNGSVTSSKVTKEWSSDLH